MQKATCGGIFPVVAASYQAILVNLHLLTTESHLAARKLIKIGGKITTTPFQCRHRQTLSKLWNNREQQTKSKVTDNKEKVVKQFDTAWPWRASWNINEMNVKCQRNAVEKRHQLLANKNRLYDIKFLASLFAFWFFFFCCFLSLK